MRGARWQKDGQEVRWFAVSDGVLTTFRAEQAIVVALMAHY